MIRETWSTLFEDPMFWGAWDYRILHNPHDHRLRLQNRIFGLQCMWRTYRLGDVVALVVSRARDYEGDYNFWVRLRKSNGRECFVFMADCSQHHAEERAEACARAIVSATGLPVQGTLD